MSTTPTKPPEPFAIDRRILELRATLLEDVRQWHKPHPPKVEG